MVRTSVSSFVAMVAVVSGAALLTLPATTAEARLSLPSKAERKCRAKLGKSGSKLADAIIKQTSRCLDDDISGKRVNACPNETTDKKVDKAAAKLAKTASKDCAGVCSTTSTLTCFSDDQCPPQGPACSGGPDLGKLCTVNSDCTFSANTCTSSNDEFCGKFKNSFDDSVTANSGEVADERLDIATVGFPGPFCEQELGHPIEEITDVSDCIESITRTTAPVFVDGIYGSITNGSGVSAGAAECLSSIAKSSRKLVLTTYKGIIKCRSAIDSGKRDTNPQTCARDDATLLKKIDKAIAKLVSTIDSGCTPATIAELDLCGNGVGATTVEQAETCIVDLVTELTDSPEIPVLRDYVVNTLVEAAYPPPAVCGDDIVNQLPSSSLRLGEECDGTDDSACPGECLPPGDLFECSCGDTPRHRFFADKDFSETDAGFTGVSHNQDVADLSGYITTLENCDCSAFTGATCTGTSADPICDVNGRQQPTCSWDPASLTSCDQHGNNDSLHNDRDCYMCDAFSGNAGAQCLNSNDCQSQCYDAGGSPTGPCDTQSDCAPGEVCRGRCDTDQYCIQIREGGPQPVDTDGTIVCTVQTIQTNATGTRNLQTGEHEIYFFERSTVHTGDDPSHPCPVCGGFCVGGKRDAGVCEGTCEISGDPCRFDSDCATGERCTQDSPDCPGGRCELSLVCSSTATDLQGNTITGRPCKITYEHRAFGTLSDDCAPLEGKNFSGPGLLVEFQPVTSEAVSLPSIHPCTASGFELYDCPCEYTGGEPTRPNNCSFGCNAPGPSFGVGCADGDTSSQGTVCVGAPNNGKLCDEDADCSPGTCSGNPTHCVGDPAFERFVCSSNGDCGSGTCVDACPGGRCLPLCVPGLFCADDQTVCETNADCTGIGDGLCDNGDPTDGVCIAGPPLYRCSGERYVLKACNSFGDAIGAPCDATCSGSGTACTSDAECPTGQSCQGPCLSHKECEAGDDGELGTNDDLLGAGACTLIPRDCFLEPAFAEGGDTLNGEGDATNGYTVALWCQDPTISPAINTGAGFPGPNRVRKHGVNVVNTPSLP